MGFETLKVTTASGICRITLNRPDAGNAINARMIEELNTVLDLCSEQSGEDDDKPVVCVVLEGGADVFCAGGDFESVAENGATGDPEPLYDVWLKLSQGPFIVISLVTGRANAGGVGFVAASDIVIAGQNASFALSELIFGLFPACVLPFLIGRIGRQRTHYMTLSTKAVSAADAEAWGLADVVCDDPEIALRQHLGRLRQLRKPAIAEYKAYLAACTGKPDEDKRSALAANRKMFSDPAVLDGIRRYVTELKFPWED